MNRPRCTDTDYIDFLVASPRVVSGTEAARTAPRRDNAPAHDAFTRLLHRLEPDPATLWHEVAPLVDRTHGILVCVLPTHACHCSHRVPVVVPACHKRSIQLLCWCASRDSGRHQERMSERRQIAFPLWHQCYCPRAQPDYRLFTTHGKANSPLGKILLFDSAPHG